MVTTCSPSRRAWAWREGASGALCWPGVSRRKEVLAAAASSSSAWLSVLPACARVCLWVPVRGMRVCARARLREHPAMCVLVRVHIRDCICVDARERACACLRVHVSVWTRTSAWAPGARSVNGAGPRLGAVAGFAFVGRKPPWPGVPGADAGGPGGGPGAGPWPP